MPRGANQKLKLLYLKQFFEEHTDEEHPATMQQMLDYLKANGVDTERKSIYTDLDALADFGMDGGRMNTAKATSGMTVILNWQK